MMRGRGAGVTVAGAAQGCRRLQIERFEILAYGLAAGLSAGKASGLAGYQWGGHASKRCKRPEILARAAALKPLVEMGAGFDADSQAHAARAIRAQAKADRSERAEDDHKVAQIVNLARAARDKAMKGHEPRTLRKTRAQAQASVAKARNALPGPNVTLPLEAWLALAGARLG